MEDDYLFSLYIKEISKKPELTEEQRKELGRRSILGDEDAKRQMIESNLRLVIKVAKKYYSPGIPVIEIISWGNMGLMKAVEKYNPDKGKFSCIAYPCIKREIQEGIKEYSNLNLRLKTQTLPLLEKAIMNIKRDKGHEPSIEEISKETYFSKKKVKKLLTILYLSNELSLDELEAGENIEGNHTREFLSEDRCNPENRTIDKKRRENVEEVLFSLLNEEERDILMARNGFYGKEITLKELGLKYNLTKERIRQKERISLGKLRNYHQINNLRDYLE